MNQGRTNDTMHRAQSQCHAMPDETDARPAYGGARNTRGKQRQITPGIARNSGLIPRKLRTMSGELQICPRELQT
eukprot:11208159-Lingulodinium_polyedra.AAC.1